MEDLAGMALFNLDKPAEAVTRLRRAAGAAPEGTPLWRTAMWHLGVALEADGKIDQALPNYIKSYLAGPPDAARRAVIENAYKKVNGSLDGLDDKIGPPPATTPAPNPSPFLVILSSP
jgi:predicted Zn-dependent protease